MADISADGNAAMEEELEDVDEEEEEEEVTQTNRMVDAQEDIMSVLTDVKLHIPKQAVQPTDESDEVVNFE